tara:strand:- start:8349 stop:10025 length:1677 start_codon:yes stop_codon:yes gene_type:complete
MINIPLFSNKAELNEYVDKWAQRNTVSMDNRDWFFCIAIDNGKQRNLFIKSGIENLVIEDDLFKWYTTGYITLRNDESALERSSGPDKMLELLQLSTTYKVRGDGRDIISINITPKLTSVKSFLAKVSGLDPRPDEDIYKLSNDYAVYDTKTEYLDNGKELRTLYFWDLRYQLLLERNTHYSTGLVKSKKDPKFAKDIRQVNNDDRAILTGDAIKEFLKHSLEDQKPEFDDKLWDAGGSNVFYSSPAQYKGINDLDWLVDSHVSSNSADNDFSIFKYDAYLKKWTLIPISKYFENALKGDTAGEYQFDKFQVSYHSGPISKFLSLLGAKNKAPKLKLSDINSKVKNPLQPIPVLGKVSRKNMLQGEVAELEKEQWNFTDLAGLDNQTLLTTYAVHSYNMSSHEFNIDVYKNEIQSVTEKFQSQYIEKNFLGDGKPATSFNITPGKKTRKVMNNLFTLSNDEKTRAVKGRNQLFKNLIFLNNACSINIKGETYRRTGRFFSIDRPGFYFDNEFDEKILGQYLVVNVKHKFNGESYDNEIIGVKPYRYSEPDFEEEKIIE